jgi:hypothetical protein
MSLWIAWWDAIVLLRPAFSRLSTFMWFATIVAGLTVRTELAGVTSIIRALNLDPSRYTTLLGKFHSSESSFRSCFCGRTSAARRARARVSR